MERVTIPDGIVIIGQGMFQNCTALTSILIPASVTEFSYAFYKCPGLNSVVLEDGLEQISDNAFSNCTSLVSVDMSDSVTNIGSWAFSSCIALSSVNLSDSLTSIGTGTFSGCRALADIEIPDGVTEIGGNAFSGTAYYVDTANWEDGFLYLDQWLIKVDTSVSGEYAVRTGTIGIAAYAAASCKELTAVELPEGLLYINEWAFYNCSSLADIILPSSVIRIGEDAFYGTAFYNTAADDGVLYLGTWLVQADTGLSGNYTVKSGTVGILDYAFAGCIELTEIILPDSVTNIGAYAFDDCVGLTEIALPDGITNIAGYTFSGCVNLTDVSLPEGLLNIGEAAFESCSTLQEIAIPDNVKNIAANAFSGCTKLSSVTLPGSLESIGEYAFSSCTALSSITIPDSVTEIGDYAFFQAGIKSVLFEDNPDMTFMEALLLYDRHTFAGTNLFNNVLPSSGSTSTDGTSPISLVCRLIARNLIENGEISNLKDAYDWICKNCDYTYSTGSYYSYANGPFFYGVAACQGYALAMKAFLDEMNYPNFILTGKVTGTWTQAI